MRPCFYLLFLFVLAAPLAAQPAFEGHIVYQFTFDIDDDQQAAQLAMVMPTSLDFKFKGTSTWAKFSGGMMEAVMGDMIVNGASQQAYLVRHTEKTAYVVDQQPPEDEPGTELPKPTGNQAMILGYSCQEYMLQTETPEGLLTQSFWISDAIQVEIPDFANTGFGLGLTLPGMEGLPLKVEMSAPGGEGSLTILATKISPESIADTLFTVPEGYAIKSFEEALQTLGN